MACRWLLGLGGNQVLLGVQRGGVQSIEARSSVRVIVSIVGRLAV